MNGEYFCCCFCCCLFYSFLYGTKNLAIHETHLLKCYFLFFCNALRDLERNTILSRKAYQNTTKFRTMYKFKQIWITFKTYTPQLTSSCWRGCAISRTVHWRPFSSFLLLRKSLVRQLIQKRTDVKKFNDLPVRTENGNSYHNTSRTELRRRILGFYYLLDPHEKLCSFPSLLPNKPEK